MSVSTTRHSLQGRPIPRMELDIGPRAGMMRVGELRFNPSTQQIEIIGENWNNRLTQWIPVRGEDNLRFIKMHRLKDSMGHSYMPAREAHLLLKMIRVEEELRSLVLDEVIYELDRMGNPERDIKPPKKPGVFILVKGVSDFQLNHALAAVP